MPRRPRATAVIGVAALVAALTGPASANPLAHAVPARYAAPRTSPTFTLDWTRQVFPKKNISTTSPVVVDNGGSPFVVAGDLAGNLRAFDLESGASIPGWSSTNAGFNLRAPISSDGRYVYVPVAQDGKDRYPQWRKYGPSGSGVWNSNQGTVYPASGGFLLSGLSLAKIDGTWRGFGGSSGHWIYGLDANTGAQRWGFRNADSTMATPALADLYGSGRPQVITSSDATAEFAGDRNGGILRILTRDGKQICSATQLVSGNTYASSGYNNSSPAVAEIGGRPLIAFGSTGPSQSGVGGNQVVAYDAACALRWASPALAGQAQASPTFADVLGTGVPQIVEMISITNGTAKYPRVYVLDAATGHIVADTGSSLSGYGASLAYTPATSIATADANDDGAQDLFVPAKQGQFLVLDGRTRHVLTTIPTNLVIQNTPIITADPNGIRVTMAGYAASGGIVSSYVLAGGTLGARGWPRFGHDSQLTGLRAPLNGPYNQMIEGQYLRPGQQLRSTTGGYTATMQADGNFVVQTSTGGVRWSTRTNLPGSFLALRSDGNVQVIGPDLSVRWQSGPRGTGAERLVLGSDGSVKVYSGTWSGTRRLNSTQAIWSNLSS